MMGIKHALVASMLVATPALAQVGGAFGLRGVTGTEADAANTDRRGFDLRALFEGGAPAFGWRVEAAFTQMQYQKDIGIDVRKVSENGMEFSAAARAAVLNGALSGAYLLAGPVASVRLNCGASGGFVDCDEGAAQKLGYVFGLGYRNAITPRRDVLFELRYVGNPVSGAGNDVVVLSIGLQLARR